ncbi:MAG: ATP-binding protein [Alphaproteobacteria bacterium]|nr:ATP-binding protein [Alphaproteobacteria bacterium]
MNRALNDPFKMEKIYKAAKNIYEGKYPEEFALLELEGNVEGTVSSLKMYFDIFKYMMNAKCYKMGTSKAFTKFLLNHIFRDYGIDAYKNALSAVKGNYEYRNSVNNPQPGLIKACEESLIECGVEISLDEIPTASIIAESKNKSKEAVSMLNNREYVTLDDENNIGLKPEKVTLNTQEIKDEMELDIQPAASILNVFSRLSYKPWYAIAEFVDNSTQSYMSHEREMSLIPDFEKLVVRVNYDAVNNTLSITDNAFGMELDRFKDAILLDAKSSLQTGRNEFGMGLKTAASWFGNVWHVSSTQYGSKNRYTATVDIPKLKKYSLNSVVIHRTDEDENIHGTEILIEDVTKKIKGSRTITKIRDLLSSMYRRDINNKNIEIFFNDEPIFFQQYPILTNFRGKSWKKDLNFEVIFNEEVFNVTGFVAIMNPGSFPKAGFALFRQDRVVVGGTDNNYKPAQIFGQAQSQKSLKLFGELNMNDFPVNQAKDGFIWDDGLEDEFISALKDNIQEYINIADMSIRERASEVQYSEESSEKVEKEVTNTINNAFGERSENKIENEKETTNNTLEAEDKSTDDVQEYVETVLNNNAEEQIINAKRQYNIPLNLVNSVKFTVQWARGNNKYWIEYNEIEHDHYEVLINIDHPFFLPFSKEDGFQKVLEKFALSFILSEREAKLTSSKDGYIPKNVIKNSMNKYLEKLAEE